MLHKIVPVVMLIATVLSISGESFAAQPQAARTGGKIFQRRQTPRFQRESYAEYIVVPRDGKMTTRQVWNGYVNSFPKPAFLYYGAPHSGDDTGIGAMDRR